MDAFFLEAVAFYRLGKPMESVDSFNKAKRLLKRLQDDFSAAGGGGVEFVDGVALGCC